MSFYSRSRLRLEISKFPASTSTDTREIGTLAVRRTHYATLELPPTATLPEIRSAYLRLILLHHPDRVRSQSHDDRQGTTAEGKAEELNAAYEVLNDFEKKCIYDQELSKARVTHEPTNGAPSTAFSVDLSLFSAHVAPGTSETDTDDEPVYYTYPCRCSGTYIVMRNQLEDGIEILSCDGCSERCRVDYQEEAEEYERGVLHREVAIMS